VLIKCKENQAMTRIDSGNRRRKQTAFPCKLKLNNNYQCTEQVLALTSHLEAGFERKLKTGTVLIDLTAAYDTV
jgi:hypothetical protein